MHEITRKLLGSWGEIFRISPYWAYNTYNRTVKFWVLPYPEMDYPQGPTLNQKFDQS